jgi:hypothetical protein
MPLTEAEQTWNLVHCGTAERPQGQRNRNTRGLMRLFRLNKARKQVLPARQLSSASRQHRFTT